MSGLESIKTWRQEQTKPYFGREVLIPFSLTCWQEQGAPTPAQMSAVPHDAPMAPQDLRRNWNEQCQWEDVCSLKPAFKQICVGLLRLWSRGLLAYDAVKCFGRIPCSHTSTWSNASSQDMLQLAVLLSACYKWECFALLVTDSFRILYPPVPYVDPKYNFTSCSLCVWNLVSHPKEGKWTESVWDQGDENIWTWERGSTRRLGKIV
jgi:hypothetical protein